MCFPFVLWLMAMWPNEDRYDALVRAASGRYGVPASLVKGVIAAESSFQPAAYRAETARASDWPAGVTSDASRGLMQLLYWRAQEMGYIGSPDGLYDPATSIELGTKLLAVNAAILGSWDGAISAYNGGIRPELCYGKLGAGCAQFRNQAYVDRVKSYWYYFETGKMPAAGFALPGIIIGALAVALAG